MGFNFFFHKEHESQRYSNIGTIGSLAGDVLAVLGDMEIPKSISKYP